MLRSMLISALCLLAACATTPVDPFDAATLTELSDSALERQWRWVHERGRTDEDIPEWQSKAAYADALRREAARRYSDWGLGVAQAVASGRILYDMTEEQVLWAVGPPDRTASYRFGSQSFTKWLGPLEGLNASWIVIFRDGVVVDITDRR